MEQNKVYELLKQIQDGQKTAEQALSEIQLQPDLPVGNYATIDLDRQKRQGMPEVIYGESKTAEQIVGIAKAMQERGIENIMVTRLSPEKAEQVRAGVTGKGEGVCVQENTASVVTGIKCSCEATGVQEEMDQESDGGKEFVECPAPSRKNALDMEYDPVSRIGVFNRKETEKIGKIVVVAAGTSDLPVAEEAAVTAELYGNHVERVYDVGVAGIHRLLHRLSVFEDANAVVAVAGMEGALVSVVGGLVACPVIGVPTSVGYGANLGGLAALLSMLNSCASGVSVVNIDNGFGAGMLAAKINHQSVCQPKN